MTIRVGILGLNYGERVHLPAYRADPRYEVVAVCARTPGRAHEVAKTYQVPTFYSDARRLLGAADVDLVSIATPPRTHPGFAAAALAAGKHAVVEIAFVGSAADARVLAAMAREQQRIGAAAYVLRYVPHIRLINDLLAQNVIGPLRLARLDYFANFLALSTLRWRWLWDLEHGGGVLAGFIAHGIDLLCQWLGPVEAVDGTLATLAEVNGLAPGLTAADDTGTLCLHFKSGLLATVNYSATVAFPHVRLELHGANGTLLIQGLGDEVSLLPMGEEVPRPVYPPAAYLEQTRGQAGLPAGFQVFLDRLAPAINTGEVPPDLPTFESGLEMMRLIDAARLSSREGRRVRIDEIG
jgi:predicted dehydrogenase